MWTTCCATTTQNSRTACWPGRGCNANTCTTTSPPPKWTYQEGRVHRQPRPRVGDRRHYQDGQTLAVVVPDANRGLRALWVRGLGRPKYNNAEINLLNEEIRRPHLPPTEPRKRRSRSATADQAVTTRPAPSPKKKQAEEVNPKGATGRGLARQSPEFKHSKRHCGRPAKINQKNSN